MEDKEIVLEQYKMMLETKEKFTERSFATNKFYYSVSVILLIAISFLYIQADASIAIVICAFMGIISSMLLYANHDTYQYLTHIKYDKVLNVIEQQLPIHPLELEKNALDEKKVTFKSFRFVDMQKLFAIASMVLFIAFALMQIVPFVIETF